MNEHTRDSRIKTKLPVSINDEQGFTKDVSATGMYIVQPKIQEVGSRIEFSIELNTSMGLMKLFGEGEVVRVEELDGKIGVAIKVLHQFGKQIMLDNLLNQS